MVSQLPDNPRQAVRGTSNLVDDGHVTGLYPSGDRLVGHDFFFGWPDVVLCYGIVSI